MSAKRTSAGAWLRRVVHPRSWPVRWRLAAASSGLTLVILLLFGGLIGKIATQRIRDDFNSEVRSAAQILAGVFSRAFKQLAAGAVIGMLAAVGLEQVLEGEMFQGQGAVILPIVAVLMTAVGLLAALGPARQGLSIQPTEALRQE